MSRQSPSPTPYSLLDDPTYYVAVVLFAILTTGLPALLGASWFLVLAQTLALWLLLLVPLRRNDARRAVIVLALWVAVQFATVFILALAAPNRLESAMGGGFGYSQSLLNWLYAGAPLPGSWLSQPLVHLLEVLGVVVGAMLTGGLVGVAFLMRAVNQFAFGAAALIASAGGVAGLMAALQPWMLLRIVGYVGLLPLLALPGFTGQWRPGDWPPACRRLLAISASLLATGLLLELFLPSPWATLFGSMMLNR